MQMEYIESVKGPGDVTVVTHDKSESGTFG